MGDASFDPLGLTAEASLNQVVIGDCGCPEVAGMRAGQACSRDAMLALATERGLTVSPPRPPSAAPGRHEPRPRRW
jgi:hypothetical protein